MKSLLIFLVLYFYVSSTNSYCVKRNVCKPKNIQKISNGSCNEKILKYSKYKYPVQSFNVPGLKEMKQKLTVRSIVNKMLKGEGGVAIIKYKDKQSMVKNDTNYQCQGVIIYKNNETICSRGFFETIKDSEGDPCDPSIKKSIVNDNVCVGKRATMDFSNNEAECKRGKYYPADEIEKLCGPDRYIPSRYATVHYFPDKSNPQHVPFPNKNKYIECQNSLEDGSCIIAVDIFGKYGEIIPEPRIIGGQFAPEGMFPYVALLTAKFRCGGAIVTKHHVLTAAHCFINDDVSKITVYAGHVNYKKMQKFKAGSKTLHPDYYQGTKENDVAVIEIRDTFPFGDPSSIAPIKLRSAPIPKPDSVCTVAGWGRIQNTGTYVYDLRYVNVKIFDLEKCRVLYAHTIYISDQFLCAAEEGKDACIGDSGGPLLYNNEVIGIVSFGMECGSPFYPGVYINVPEIFPWINHTISERKYSCASCLDVNIILVFFTLLLIL